MYSLYDLFNELETWIHTDSATYEKALTSGINKNNNQHFATLLRSWEIGVYDEDVDMLHSELTRLLDRFMKNM